VFRFLTGTAAAVATVLALHVGTARAGPPPGFELKTVVAGLETPTSLAYAPDGRIFVGEKSGLVKVYDGGRLHTFVDLRNEVNDISDRGLLSLELDPDFAANGFVYLSFTQELAPAHPDSERPAGGKVIRLRAFAGRPNAANPSTRQTLVSGFNSYGLWHSVGGMDFDREGRLIVAFGDGHLYAPKEFGPQAMISQRLNALNGKVLRIDRATGMGVPGNPYFDPTHPGSLRSRILARGFRTPFRVHVDPSTQDVYVGDVGSDYWDEIDVIPATWASTDQLDFGWPCFEGGDGKSEVQPKLGKDPRCDRLTTGGRRPAAPLYAYRRDGGATVIGGPVYTGTSYPDRYRGRIFFSDFSRGRFYTLTEGRVEEFGDSAGEGASVDITQTPDGTIAYAAISANAVNEFVYHRPFPVGLAAAGTSGAIGAMLVGLAWLLHRRRPEERRRELAGRAEPQDTDPVHLLVWLERKWAFQMHVLAYVAGTVFLTAIWVVTEHERAGAWPAPLGGKSTTGGWSLWILYPVLGWGLLVAIEGLVVYLRPRRDRELREALEQSERAPR
jgi:glucose/arabinose dehydrogenase